MQLNLTGRTPQPDPPKILFETYLIHTEENPSSIVVGSDRTLRVACEKARMRSGIHYIYKWCVTDNEAQTLIDPVLETTVYK